MRKPFAERSEFFLSWMGEPWTASISSPVNKEQQSKLGPAGWTGLAPGGDCWMLVGAGDAVARELVADGWAGLLQLQIIRREQEHKNRSLALMTLSRLTTMRTT